MAYTVKNFKSKTVLKSYVKDSLSPGFKADPVRCYELGLGPDLSNFTGRVFLEGPHYPQAHTWYAEAELKDGVVIKVK